MGSLRFSGSLASFDNVSKVTTCIPGNNQPFMTRPTLLSLNPKECNQGLRYYPFMVYLEKCTGSYSTLDDPFCKICVPNKTENVNLTFFLMS